MAEKEKKDVGTESLEVTELEDSDLADVAGGVGFQQDPVSNSGCPTNVNCPCPT